MSRQGRMVFLFFVLVLAAGFYFYQNPDLIKPGLIPFGSPKQPTVTADIFR